MAVVNIKIDEICNLSGLSEEKIIEALYKIGMPCEKNNSILSVEVTPNRIDLYSVEGIARALRSFYFGEIKNYRVLKSPYKIIVENPPEYRPFVIGAIVKNVNFREDVLLSVIQLQEKLHETVGRKRKKIAIGLHDLSKVRFPVKYCGVEEIKFIPLGYDYEMSIEEILTKHEKGKMYRELVFKPYPLISDEEGVLSLPPIINSERTKLNENTNSVFIEITGTHLPVMDSALKVISCALADRGGKVYSVKVNFKGKEIYELNLKNAEFNLKENNNLKYKNLKEAVKKISGLELNYKEISNYLQRMGIKFKNRKIFLPPFRSDIINIVDVVEDILIAYGYENIVPSIPELYQPSRLENQFEDLREVMLRMGFVEVVNFVLTNEEVLKKINYAGEKLKVENSKSEEFSIVRPSLLPSLLENLKENKTAPLPIKLFEIGRVVEDDKEKLKLGFVYSDFSADFSIGKGIVIRIFEELNSEYDLEKSFEKIFLSGRGANIIYKNKKIGLFGELNPEILERFKLHNPVVYGEIELKEFQK